MISLEVANQLRMAFSTRRSHLFSGWLLSYRCQSSTVTDWQKWIEDCNDAENTLLELLK